MRISLKWLQELVDFDLSPVELAEALTLAGFEVEDIEDRRTWADGVIVGQILQTQPHPNADRLQVCQVDVGQGDPLTIVCGAANARAGLTVAVAVPGTHLPALGVTITQADKRGVTSAGMICSLAELGLAKSSEGIHEFAEAYRLGSDVRPLLGLDDVVLDLTSTANRADALSMVGIAREVAALTRNPVRLPNVSPLSSKGIPTCKLAIADAQACPAYSGVLIRGVTIGASPDWLRQRLEAAGTRSINNVVDITNLILLEWGQPLHAFDWQKLQAVMGSHQEVGVRLARVGESLKTLDGKERPLQPENLLITAADQPVALAGVMGGEDTEVNEQTQDIFLEAALFDPVVIRRSARAQGLRTEASARYERGVDFSALDRARDRAVQMIQQLAGGSLVGQTTVDQRPSPERQIQLRLSRLIDILGDDVRAEDVETILPALGFVMSPCHKVETPAKKAMAGQESRTTAQCVWDVRVPAYRLRDIEREIDLIEEFARLYGYDHFSETLPPETQVGSLSPRERSLRLIREAFRSVGLTELLSVSLCPAESGAEVLISNPLSPEFSAVRSQLLPGLLEAFRYNWDQGNGALLGFEIGRVFAKTEQGYQEADHLAGILGGDPYAFDWQHQQHPYDWYAAKGLLVAALQRLGLAFTFAADATDPQFHPGRTAQLLLAGTACGRLGQLHPQVRQAHGLPDSVFAFEFNLDPLLTVLETKGIPQFQAFSTFPSSDRDIAFFAPQGIPVARLEEAIREAAGHLLESVHLFDEYRGTGVPDQQRSLAFRLIYRAPDRTLTDAEVESAQKQVRAALEKQFQVTLRS
ncbi:MAG: phenylalanine--tRNA ligase subunit beta [Cyanobacteriota bacterium]|nr:phenylalanine--tRNA ligase subunit beta [Cyanobacteriota bacterium]